MEKMDRASLAQFNGQDGKKALIAYDGKIYDVTASKRWKGGKHMLRHEAGRDLTVDLKAAPHGPEVFQNFPPVAELAADAAADEGPRLFWPLTWLFAKFPILKRHSHPVAVHFPIGSLAGAFVFAALAYLFEKESFAWTAVNMVLFGTVFVPLAFLTGLQSWWLYYGLKATPGILTKLIGAPILFVLGLVAWSIADAAALARGQGLGFVALSGVMTVLAFFLGYIGGQMTFPD